MNRKLPLFMLVMLLWVVGVLNTGHTQTCSVGDIIGPGGSCTYPGTPNVFSVDATGKARFLFFTAGGNIQIRDANINGRRYTLVTELTEGGGRRITELGSSIAPSPTTQDDFTLEITPTLISDHNLAAAIREELGTSITRQSLRKLTHLEVPNRRIRSLQGLQHAYHLRYLDLGSEFIAGIGNVNSNRVSDFSPLVGLPHFAFLRVDRNGISDLSTLARVRQIKYLSLDDNAIRNVGPLSGLTQLIELSLDSNAITNINPLLPLRRLKYLSLNNNAIRNVGPLSALTELKALHLFNNGISDLSPLLELSLVGTRWDRTGLDIRWNPLSSVSINTHIPALRAKWIQVVYAGNTQRVAGAPALLGETKLSAIEVERLQAQIDLLVASGDRSPSAMRTLIYLQQLIATARPEKTQLLANYPNPFNPETWIPYELATDTEVRLTIYNTHGVVIRSLELGHQSAGYYTGRDRAAYWDGRNALGEQVASGLYFYQLETDTQSLLRKMVILK
jgi:Leucine-rich repeat (LRR) protein